MKTSKNFNFRSNGSDYIKQRDTFNRVQELEEEKKKEESLNGVRSGAPEEYVFVKRSIIIKKNRFQK